MDQMACGGWVTAMDQPYTEWILISREWKEWILAKGQNIIIYDALSPDVLIALNVPPQTCITCPSMIESLLWLRGPA